MSIVPGRYKITTGCGPGPAIGVDPRTNSAIKPVVVAPPEFSPAGTTWEVLVEDGQLYLLIVDGANTRSDESKVFAYYGQPGERWKIVPDPLCRGYTILTSDGSLAWYLPNPNYLTQVELSPLEPGKEGYCFTFREPVPGQ